MVTLDSQDLVHTAGFGAAPFLKKALMEDCAFGCLPCGIAVLAISPQAGQSAASCIIHHLSCLQEFDASKTQLAAGMGSRQLRRNFKSVADFRLASITCR